METSTCRWCGQAVRYSAPKDEFIGVLENEGISQLSRWRHTKNGRVPCDLYAEPIPMNVDEVIKTATRYGATLGKLNAPKRPLYPAKKSRPRGMTQADIKARNKKIQAEKKAGATIYQLAETYDLTVTRIRQILKGV